MSPLRLVLPTEVESPDDSPQTSIELGYTCAFDWDDNRLRDIPLVVRDRLSARSAFWHTLGVETGPSISAFITEHFDKLPIDFANSHETPEIDWLRCKAPEVHKALLSKGTQQQNGDGPAPLKFSLWRLKRAPDITIRNTLLLASGTQQNFISTWLPRFVENNQWPVILDSDQATIEASHQSASAKLAALEQPTYRQALELALQCITEAAALDFDG